MDSTVKRRNVFDRLYITYMVNNTLTIEIFQKICQLQLESKQLRGQECSEQEEKHFSLIY